MKLVSKFCGALAARLTRSFLPLSFLTVSVYSKFEFDAPRSCGNCGWIESLAGNSLARLTAIGSVTCVPLGPSAFTVSVLVPILASLGTSSRRSSATLSSVAGMAAATGWPPPKSVAFQPCGTPETVSASRSGARP